MIRLHHAVTLGYTMLFTPIRLHYAVTPLIDIPYQEQLGTKSDTMREILKKMAYKITHRDSHPVRVTLVYHGSVDVGVDLHVGT